MRPHRIVIGCAAAASLILAPATAALASAHGNHGPAGGHGSHAGQHGGHGSAHGNGGTNGHGSGHGNGHGKDHGSRDRLAGPRGAAGHVLKAQAARLARLMAAVDAGEALDAGNQAALFEALQADLGALTAGQSAIPEATNVHELNAIKHAAVLTVTIAVRQVEVVTEADGVEKQAADRAGTVSDLAVQVAIAADTGQPMGAAQAAIEDAQAELAAAEADAQNAVTAILGVSPTASRAELEAASEAAAQALLDAANALTKVDADLATVDAALGL